MQFNILISAVSDFHYIQRVIMLIQSDLKMLH